MCMFAAQTLFFMWCEIDDQQTTGGPQGAGRLAHGAGRIVEIVQHLMDNDEIIVIVLDGQGIYIALAKLDVAQASLFEAIPGKGQHLRRLVDADGTGRARREQFEHPTGSGAEIEQGMDRRPSDQIGDSGLDPFLADMQRPDLVPIGRMGSEMAQVC
jgi:hypothetical protein